jgi:hypothetical protein
MADIDLDTTSVNITRSADVELRSDAIEVSAGYDKPLVIEAEPRVEVVKKEYSIVGDGLYASVNAEEAPLWLTSIIDQVTTGALAASNSNLTNATAAVTSYLTELEIARNNYQELINISATIDQVITSKLATLDATIKSANAKIVNLEAASVTPDQAVAIVANAIQASVNGGAIAARIGTVQSTVANHLVSQASKVEVLTAEFETLDENVNSAVATLENTVSANADQAMAKFSYDATLKLNGTYYSSGFGLKTLLDGSTDLNNPSGSSEFWVRADKTRFVGSSDNLILEGDSQGLTFPGAGSIKSAGYNLANNSGVFMGYNPDSLKYELMAGNGTNYMRWDGSSLNVKGNISGSSINIPDKLAITEDGTVRISDGVVGGFLLTSAPGTGETHVRAATIRGSSIHANSATIATGSSSTTAIVGSGGDVGGYFSGTKGAVELGSVSSLPTNFWPLGRSYLNNKTCTKWGQSEASDLYIANDFSSFDGTPIWHKVITSEEMGLPIAITNDIFMESVPYSNYGLLIVEEGGTHLHSPLNSTWINIARVRYHGTRNELIDGSIRIGVYGSESWIPTTSFRVVKTVRLSSGNGTGNFSYTGVNFSGTGSSKVTVPLEHTCILTLQVRSISFYDAIFTYYWRFASHGSTENNFSSSLRFKQLTINSRIGQFSNADVVAG